MIKIDGIEVGGEYTYSKPYLNLTFATTADFADLFNRYGHAQVIEITFGERTTHYYPQRLNSISIKMGYATMEYLIGADDSNQEEMDDMRNALNTLGVNDNEEVEG